MFHLDTDPLETNFIAIDPLPGLMRVSGVVRREATPQYRNSLVALHGALQRYVAFLERQQAREGHGGFSWLGGLGSRFEGGSDGPGESERGFPESRSRSKKIEDTREKLGRVEEILGGL